MSDYIPPAAVPSFDKEVNRRSIEEVAFGSSLPVEREDAISTLKAFRESLGLDGLKVASQVELGRLGPGAVVDPSLVEGAAVRDGGGGAGGGGGALTDRQKEREEMAQQRKRERDDRIVAAQAKEKKRVFDENENKGLQRLDRIEEELDLEPKTPLLDLQATSVLVVGASGEEGLRYQEGEGASNSSSSSDSSEKRKKCPPKDMIELPDAEYKNPHTGGAYQAQGPGEYKASFRCPDTEGNFYEIKNRRDDSTWEAVNVETGEEFTAECYPGPFVPVSGEGQQVTII